MIVVTISDIYSEICVGSLWENVSDTLMEKGRVAMVALVDITKAVDISRKFVLLAFEINDGTKKASVLEFKELVEKYSYVGMEKGFK